MAVIYVHDEGDNSTGVDYAHAFQSITHASVLGAASGAEIHVASDHTEQVSEAHIDISFTNGSVSDPIKIISSKSSDDTYENMETGGGVIETLTENYDITLSGFLDVYGLKFVSEDFFYLQTITTSGLMRLHDCYIDATDDIALTSNQQLVEINDCTILPRALMAFGQDTRTNIRGCVFSSVYTGGHFNIGTKSSTSVLIEDCDLSSEADVFFGEMGAESSFVLRRCSLASSYSLFDNIFTQPTITCLVESCVAGTSTDPIVGMQKLLTYYGVVSADTTYFRTGGASDGTTPVAWKMNAALGADESTAINYVNEYTTPLRSPPIPVLVPAGGGTLTVYLQHASVGSGTSSDLQNDEFWLEVSSGDTASPATSKGIRQTSLPATILTAPTDLDNDAVSSWDSELAVLQKVSVAITQTEEGWAWVTCCLGINAIVYVDPAVVVT